MNICTHLAVLPASPADEAGKWQLIIVCLLFSIDGCHTVGFLCVWVPSLKDLLLLRFLLLSPVLPCTTARQSAALVIAWNEHRFASEH